MVEKAISIGLTLLKVFLPLAVFVLSAVQVIYAVASLVVGCALAVGGALLAYNGYGTDTDLVIVGGIMCGIGLILLK